MRVAGMVDLRIELFGVESPTTTRQHEREFQMLYVRRESQGECSGVEYVPTENGCCRKGEGRGVSKSRRFRITLERRRTRLDWDSASPDLCARALSESRDRTNPTRLMSSVVPPIR